MSLRVAFFSGRIASKRRQMPLFVCLFFYHMATSPIINLLVDNVVLIRDTKWTKNTIVWSSSCRWENQTWRVWVLSKGGDIVVPSTSWSLVYSITSIKRHSLWKLHYQSTVLDLLCEPKSQNHLILTGVFVLLFVFSKSL